MSKRECLDIMLSFLIVDDSLMSIIEQNRTAFPDAMDPRQANLNGDIANSGMHLIFATQELFHDLGDARRAIVNFSGAVADFSGVVGRGITDEAARILMNPTFGEAVEWVFGNQQISVRVSVNVGDNGGASESSNVRSLFVEVCGAIGALYLLWSLYNSMDPGNSALALISDALAGITPSDVYELYQD